MKKPSDRSPVKHETMEHGQKCLARDRDRMTKRFIFIALNETRAYDIHDVSQMSNSCGTERTCCRLIWIFAVKYSMTCANSMLIC